MVRRLPVGRLLPGVSVQTVVGVMLVAAAVAVTFFLNVAQRPATVEVLVAQNNIASGVTVGSEPQLFGTVSLPRDTPLRPLFLTWDDLLAHDGSVLVRPVREGEPLLVTALTRERVDGTVLSLSLPRVAALDGDVVSGETVRVVTADGVWFVVDVLTVRPVGGGLGRQEQVALTVRVASAVAAAQLFVATQNGPVLLVRGGA